MSNPLLDRLVVVFGPPQSDDPQAYLREVQKLIAKYTPTELDKAADLLVRSSKWFPKPAEIAVACADAREMLTPSQPFDPAKKKNLDWTKEALDRADRLIQSDLGRRAADEGWVLALWDHYRKTPRQPSPKEIIGFKTKADEFNEAYRDSMRIDICRVIGLPKLGELILARRAQKAALTQGEIISRRLSDTAVRGKMRAAGDAA